MSLNKTLLGASLAASLLAPLMAQAVQIPEGLLGLRLGDTRAQAIEQMLEFEVTPDVEKTICSDQVPERNKSVADRICKMPIQAGATFLSLPLNKVSLMLKDDRVVLIGLDVGDVEETYTGLVTRYKMRFGDPVESKNKTATWREPVADEMPNAGKRTTFKLIADDGHTYIVYAFEEVK